ncbi:hypothetical protein COCNU_scaffold000719G000010 [Cocos nucifera]|nr:hypothetical protein [Cocos nucifera]
MEDIKITFAQEAFVEGFQIYLERVAENFFKVDLDLLMEEPNDKADPSSLRVRVIPIDIPSSSAMGAILEAPEPLLQRPSLPTDRMRIKMLQPLLWLSYPRSRFLKIV